MKKIAKTAAVAAALMLALAFAGCKGGGGSSDSGGTDDEYAAPVIAKEKAVDSSGSEIEIEKSGGTRVITSGTKATYTFSLEKMRNGPYSVTFTGAAQNASGDCTVYMLAGGSTKASVCPFSWSTERKAYSFILCVPDSYEDESVSFNIELPEGTTQIEGLKVAHEWYNVPESFSLRWNMWMGGEWNKDAWIKDFAETTDGMSGTLKMNKNAGGWAGVIGRNLSAGELYAISFEITAGSGRFCIGRMCGDEDTWSDICGNMEVSAGNKYYGVFPVLQDGKKTEYEMQFTTQDDKTVTVKNLKVEKYSSQNFNGYKELPVWVFLLYGKNWQINMGCGFQNSASLPVMQSYAKDSITVSLPKDLEDEKFFCEIRFPVVWPEASSSYYTVEAMVSGPEGAKPSLDILVKYDNDGWKWTGEAMHTAVQATAGKKIFSYNFPNPYTWNNDDLSNKTGSPTNEGAILFEIWKAGTYTISSPKAYRTETNVSYGRVECN